MQFFYDNALAIVLGASLGTILLGLALSKRKRDLFHSHPRQSTFDQVVAKEAIERRASVGLPRVVGKRRELAMPYTRKPTVVFTPRQIERVNIVRKQQGRAPFNRAGLKNAVSVAWDTPRREPTTAAEWLTFLIMYEILIADHQAPHCAGAGGITIDPNQPYNGGGGEFAGAGASGDWTSPTPVVSGIAAGIVVGASATYIASQLEGTDPRSDAERQADAVVSTYQRSDAAFDVPSNPPDSPRSAPADTGGGTGSSPVSDSAPSYTSSPDTSSGGGGDSGGGGGGGGD